MGNVLNRILILHPEFEALKSDVEKLRTEISMLVLERDHLLFHECKNIEMDYMLSLGALEYKAYEVECVVLRLKRKVDLLQAKKNRQEKIDMAEIESVLDIEFADYQERLAERLGKMNAALERNKGGLLSKSETLELRKLYRAVVKELHPDLHPDLTEEQLHLFHLAVDAYERGDLRGLRAIHVVVAHPPAIAADSSGMSFLSREKERLLEILNQLRQQIESIKTSFPFTLKIILQNPELTEARKVEINDRIESLNEALAAYQRRIDQMWS